MSSNRAASSPENPELPRKEEEGHAVVCPRCGCPDLTVTPWEVWERCLVAITGKLKYRCESCETLFRAPDRPGMKRGGDALVGARAAGILRM